MENDEYEEESWGEEEERGEKEREMNEEEERVEKINQEILTAYKNGEPIHLICTKFLLKPFELTDFIRERGLDFMRTYKLEGKVDYDKFSQTKHCRTEHLKLVYSAIQELWDGNKTFITVDDPPRPDVIVIDWENREVIAVEAQMDSADNMSKAKMYNDNNPLKPFDTLILYNHGSRKQIELIKNKVKNMSDIFMKCVKCNHKWKLKPYMWSKVNKKYSQCSVCKTNNLIPEALLKNKK